jgi:hypothetical protein
MLVSGSEAPGAGLVFSKVSNDRKSINVEGKAKQSLIDDSEGVSHLVQNPMTLEMLASASEQGGDLHLWKCDPESWSEDSH